MKIQLSENGHYKDWKPLKELSVIFAQTEDGPFGKDYHFLIFESESDIAKLFNNFDKNSELEVYFFKDILYFTIESEPFFYFVEMYDNDFKELKAQINESKKILIGTLKDEKIEKMFSYSIIM